MNREKNILHFSPDEKEKFLRAITLIERIVGYGDGEDSAEHEKAHIDAMERFGLSGSIKGYKIEVRKKRKFGIGKLAIHFGEDYVRMSVMHDGNMSGPQKIRMSMAPAKPSIYDFYDAMSVLNYKEEFPIFARFMQEKDGASKYRDYLLSQAALLEKGYVPEPAPHS